MSSQTYDPIRNVFRLDLHGVETSEARRAIRERLKECFRLGIDEIEIIFGTPDRYRGSIAEALHLIAVESSELDPTSLPGDFWLAPETFTKQTGSLTIRLANVLRAASGKATLRFAPFSAKYEKDVWNKCLCEHWFQPLKEWYSAVEVKKLCGRLVVSKMTEDLPELHLTAMEAVIWLQFTETCYPSW